MDALGLREGAANIIHKGIKSGKEVNNGESIITGGTSRQD
jgi:hypothetical protein